MEDTTNTQLADKDEMEKPNWKKYAPFAAVVAIVAIIAAVVAVVVGGGKSLPQTEPPTSTPTVTSTEDYVREILLAVSKETDLNDETSHQLEALNWLVFDDPLQMDFQNEDRDHILDRYRCALFYFATGGPDSWLNDLNFLSDSSVCDWNTINDVDKGFGGIDCDLEGFVSGIVIGTYTYARSCEVTMGKVNTEVLCRFLHLCSTYTSTYFIASFELLYLLVPRTSQIRRAGFQNVR